MYWKPPCARNITFPPFCSHHNHMKSCAPIFLVRKIRPVYTPNLSDFKAHALSTTLCCYSENQYCSFIYKLHTPPLSFVIWLWGTLNYEWIYLTVILRGCQCHMKALSHTDDPFSSCLCLLLIIKQTFPHVNDDKPTNPISFHWFIPLKL